jgi:hypothetical protein
VQNLAFTRVLPGPPPASGVLVYGARITPERTATGVLFSVDGQHPARPIPLPADGPLLGVPVVRADRLILERITPPTYQGPQIRTILSAPLANSGGAALPLTPLHTITATLDSPRLASWAVPETFFAYTESNGDLYGRTYDGAGPVLLAPGIGTLCVRDSFWQRFSCGER